MGKKKNKKKKKNNEFVYSGYANGFIELSQKDKKGLNKEFKRAIKDIESMQIKLMEADKKQDKKNKKKINKKEQEFYTSMSSIKARQKMGKKWEETGFLDKMIGLLQQAVPIIKILAKSLCCLLITFLSIDAIKQSISPDLLSKIMKVFNIAMAV